MQPTCFYADKNLSTETNLQRSRSPATNQYLLGKTNKKMFSLVLGLHCIISLRLNCAVGLACVDMNSGFRYDQMFLFFGGSDTDNYYDQHNGYRPNYSNFPETLLCLPTAVLAQFRHPSHSELVHYLAPAVCHLNLPHLQHHQSPLMLKFLVRPVKSEEIIIFFMQEMARRIM